MNDPLSRSPPVNVPVPALSLPLALPPPALIILLCFLLGISAALASPTTRCLRLALAQSRATVKKTALTLGLFTLLRVAPCFADDLPAPAAPNEDYVDPRLARGFTALARPMGIAEIGVAG